MPDAETLVHAFITSRLNFCNALFSGLSSTALKKLQLAQNVAAWILTRKFKHITLSLLILASYWLPINAMADFKVLLLYKILHGPVILKEPHYLIWSSAYFKIPAGRSAHYPKNQDKILRKQSLHLLRSSSLK
ncbi:hypothetical protein LDENG_00218610 [Lucifuga dentata]|nr:hypothetical protein LDENG_00218610 [Lucifuga dentata]